MGEYLQRDGIGVALARDQLVPGLCALADDVGSVPRYHTSANPRFTSRNRKRNSLLVLALSGESKLVLGLAIWNLVDTEPLIGCPQQAREVTLHILDIIEFGRQWIVHINDDNLPVGLLLVKQRHDTKHFDLFDLTSEAHGLTNLANVKRVVVTLSFGLGVDGGRVLPGLGESTVVPEVSLVRKTVADESNLALLDVLLDGIEEFLFADLEFAVCPTRDLDDHVQDSLLLTVTALD